MHQAVVDANPSAHRRWERRKHGMVRRGEADRVSAPLEQDKKAVRAADLLTLPTLYQGPCRLVVRQPQPMRN